MSQLNDNVINKNCKHTIPMNKMLCSLGKKLNINIISIIYSSAPFFWGGGMAKTKYAIGKVSTIV